MHTAQLFKRNLTGFQVSRFDQTLKMGCSKEKQI